MPTKTNGSSAKARVVPSVQQLLWVADRDLTTTMAERFRMGPFYSFEVRKELKEALVLLGQDDLDYSFRNTIPLPISSVESGYRHAL